MISTYLKKSKQSACAAILMVVLFLTVLPESILADTSVQSLSVTPTLFQMSAVPGQTWKSSVKVINSNKSPLTVYANVVNFAPQGESGQGKFLPILDESTATATLAGWIDITRDPVTIPPQQSREIPLTVSIPQDVTPGGHFAAILIGTKAPENKGITQVGTSQIVTSLFFVRIAGDVIEDGRIREFDVKNTFSDVPKADFSVRFENKGNVLLQPQGDITITNMWGKERGVIPINHQTHFGNVLPESIRKFDFSWSGEPSFTDIGRYTAILTLAYGDDNRQFVTSKTYFYVIPVKGALIVIGSLLALIFFVTWMIKAYVRKMLSLAGVEPSVNYSARQQRRSYVREGDVRIEKRVSMSAPVERGVLDLKHTLSEAHAWKDKLRSLFAFIVQYKIFFISFVFVVIAVTSISLFILNANTSERAYQVTINNAGSNVTLSSEDVIYNQQKLEHPAIASTSKDVKEQNFDLVIINSSDTPGAAAALESALEAKGYTIDHLESDFSRSKNNTVIVYTPSVQSDALALSAMLDHALLSADTQNSSSTSKITIYLGNDYQVEK